MKISQLAKELKLKSNDVIKIIQNMGYNHSHHAQTVDSEIVEKVRVNAKVFFGKPKSKTVETRPLFGINLTGTQFSVVEFSFTGGKFDDKLRAIAKDLKIDLTDLKKSLEKHGYPAVKNEITEDIPYKSRALLEFEKQVRNSIIVKPEDV